MKRLIFITILCCVLVNLITSQGGGRIREEPVAMMVAAPPTSENFSARCRNPSVYGFTLSATCTDEFGSSRRESVNFSDCVFNYNGRLTNIRDPNMQELFSKNCYSDGYNLICQCEQRNGNYRYCSINLDRAFNFLNNRLSC